MAASFDYIYPTAATVSDNQSHTTKGLLILKTCVGGIPNGCEGLWNETLCGNDQYYAQPFVRGDKIYQQFHFDKASYPSVRFFVVDCTTLEETEVFAQECKTDVTREDFQNLEIDTTLLPNCFFIKARLFDCLPCTPAVSESYITDRPIIEEPITITIHWIFLGEDIGPITFDPDDVAQAEADFNAALSAAFPGFTATVQLNPTGGGISEWNLWHVIVTSSCPAQPWLYSTPEITAFGGGEEQPTFPGMFELGEEPTECNEIASHCTEPYEEVRCDYPTLLIEGTYTKDDCFGNHYADTQDCANNGFRNLYRIPGELIQDGYDFAQTQTADINVSVTQRRRYTLMLQKLPAYVADRIAIAFGGQDFTIDGIAYKGNIKLDKDFEFGRSWIIRTTLYQECTTDFGCE